MNKLPICYKWIVYGEDPIIPEVNEGRSLNEIVSLYHLYAKQECQV